MRNTILMTTSLTLAATAAAAGTFDHARIAPGLGLDVLNRDVARAQVGRQLFSDPYATVTIGNVDVYDVFPYVESRTFQIVSDPAWNRLVYGETGRTLKAFDGAGTGIGRMKNPRGLAVDEAQHVYVADAGNNRVVVMQATTEFGEMQLVPAYTIDGLSDPQDVAYSDGGTPFAPGDDHLYVADTGRNRVLAYALNGRTARLEAAIGDLGNGPGRFAGPMAIAAGRSGGVQTNDVFVADAHTRRLVQLRLEQGGFRWIQDVHHDADVVTSLDTDAWGNVYAAAPNRGTIEKWSPALAPVAELRRDLSRPKSFHVPFVNVNDHRSGSLLRVGQPNGVSVDTWNETTGMRLWGLGVEVANLAVTGEAPAASFMLTDQASVMVEVSDPANGRVLSRQPAGSLAAGAHSVALRTADLAAASAGELAVRVVATSNYTDGASAMSQARFTWTGGTGGMVATRSRLLGNTPNPVSPMTRISFVLPTNRGVTASLRIFDALGRTVRTFDSGFAPGVNEVLWDGTAADGREVPAGVYFYRLRADDQDDTRRMVVVR